ncbi:darcynin family protein [Mesoterricola silvestris]|uniref:Darcynin n=1 Tax=Mesoterricola silvestris TaxID=2927979 RepID=A0AA48H1Z6_9BACT|nr:darcynin family protein [Mesoterricola silvestris]BDU74533.1 hypothetical protein METEAL_37070 [Mesoterricola silvestris]
MKYMVVMTMKFSSAWLAMPREQRNRFNETRLGPILGRYQERVRLRFFDAEAFRADVSDFVLFEFEDPKDYYFLMEELRDTELFTQDWITVKDLFLGIEGGYREFEKEMQHE